MFYRNQTESQKNTYKSLLKSIGQLTRLFSESESPFLHYRIHENVFCLAFDADNLARGDISADAKKDGLGIALKTWVGQNAQKIAEFGQLRNNYAHLSDLEMMKEISKYRNSRIKTTKNMHGIKEFTYHIVKRVPEAMQIIECAFEEIDIQNIRLIPARRGRNTIYFTDKKHTYFFNTAKNTLYMVFELEGKILDEFKVDILDDPYTYISNIMSVDHIDVEKVSPKPIEISVVEKITSKAPTEILCLKLYSEDKNLGKYIPEKSGLNLWNAAGRIRNLDEIYIPYPSDDRKRSEGFFPNRNKPFDLYLPDGKKISAKVCQQDGKAIMSNPNKDLGKWLLRDVFELQPGKLITYDMLVMYGIDSVIFTKLGEGQYKIDFTEIGTYEDYLNELAMD